MHYEISNETGEIKL